MPGRTHYRAHRTGVWLLLLLQVVRVAEACVPVIQHACAELCTLLILAARRKAAQEVRLMAQIKISNLLAAVEGLGMGRMLVDSALGGAVELRSDFGDSRAADPRVQRHHDQMRTAAAEPEPAAAAAAAAAATGQPVVNEYLLQAQPIADPLEGNEISLPATVGKWLLEEEPEAAPADGDGAGTVAGTVAADHPAEVSPHTSTSTGTARLDDGPVALNEFL